MDNLLFFENKPVEIFELNGQVYIIEKLLKKSA